MPKSFDPAAFARTVYSMRRVRRGLFNPHVFGEPGWDILLDLYISRSEGRPVTVTDACIGADVPATTALRWLTKLEKLGLIFRRAGKKDRRVVHVHICQSTRTMMDKLLYAMAAELLAARASIGPDRK